MPHHSNHIVHSFTFVRSAWKTFLHNSNFHRSSYFNSSSIGINGTYEIAPMPPESSPKIPSITSTNPMKVVQQTLAAPDAPTCWYFRRGECHFGWRCKNRHERDGPIVRPSFNTTKVTSDQTHLAAMTSQSAGPTNRKFIHPQFPVLANSPPP